MPACRICYEEGNEELLSPCACTGSVQYAHKRCLRKWLLVAGRSHCELCKTPYRFDMPVLEYAFEPHYMMVRFSTRPYLLFLINILLYLLYLLCKPRSFDDYRHQTIEYHMFISARNAIPYSLIGLFGVQMAIFAPAMYRLHNKIRYIRYLCSFTYTPPGMRFSPGLFLSIMIGGFATSFYIPIIGAFICLFFMTNLYPIHGLLITAINKDAFMDSLLHDLN